MAYRARNVVQVTVTCRNPPRGERGFRGFVVELMEWEMANGILPVWSAGGSCNSRTAYYAPSDAKQVIAWLRRRHRRAVA